MIRSELLDFTTIGTECDSILQELDVVAGMIKKLVDENAAKAADQSACVEQYNTLVERYESLQTRYDALQQRERKQIQAEAIGNCLIALEEVDLLDITFSEALWTAAVDHVTVYSNDTMVFHFKNTKAEVHLSTGREVKEYDEGKQI